MHGSVCLFSKYLQHLFEGENLDELDISSASSSNNYFRNQKTLSTGWTGTCPTLELFVSAQINIDSEISSLNTIIINNHQITISSYNTTNTNLFSVSTITATGPSGATETLTPNFEYEFKDQTNTSSIGRKIYYDFNNKLKPYVEKQTTNIINNILPFVNANNLKSSVNDAYTNCKL